MSVSSETTSHVKKKSLVFLLAALIVFIAGAESKRFHSIAGPFRIVIKRIEHCPLELEQNLDKIDFYLRSARTSFKQSPTYNGNMSLPFILNDTISALGSAASWSSMGGWKDNAHVFRLKHACSSIGEFLPQIWKSWQMAWSGETPGCPLLPGIYRFENFTLTWDDIPIQNFFYGRWRIDMFLLNTKQETAGCIRGFGDTVPK